mgnify:CR=1 FL=1
MITTLQTAYQLSWKEVTQGITPINLHVLNSQKSVTRAQ